MCPYMRTKKRELCAFDDRLYLPEDGIGSIAFVHREIRRLVSDIEDDAQVGVVMSQTEVDRYYEKSLRNSRQRRDQTLQSPCAHILSTVTGTTTAQYM